MMTIGSPYISPSMHSHCDENSRIYSQEYVEEKPRKSRDNANN